MPNLRYNWSVASHGYCPSAHRKFIGAIVVYRTALYMNPECQSITLQLRLFLIIFAFDCFKWSYHSKTFFFFLSVSFSFSCFQNERENHNSLQHMLVTLLGTLKFSSVWKLALLIFYGVCHSCFYQNWLELLLCGLIVLTESHPWLRGRYKDW